jgi:hypothetical protein
MAPKGSDKVQIIGEVPCILCINDPNPELKGVPEYVISTVSEVPEGCVAGKIICNSVAVWLKARLSTPLFTELTVNVLDKSKIRLVISDKAL